MTDPELVEFLQWALPRLRMRWRGFRKVRKQVRKRISRRIKALGLEALQDYRDHLMRDPEEWRYVFTAFVAMNVARNFESSSSAGSRTSSKNPART